MLALAAARLGFRTHVFGPSADEPAFDVCAARTIAPYDDPQALDAFAKSVDVVTYEFENVPAATAEFLEARAPVRPNPRALALTQDRLVEKEFVQALGIETAPFADVPDGGALARAVAKLGRPSILKTRRLGYDGKGQVLIKGGGDLGALFRALGGAPCILEGFVNFAKEVSVVAARGVDGEFHAYDISENRHENHILTETRAPADVLPETAARAKEIARRIAEAEDYVGVLAVELFLVREKKGERLIVNEIAPRVHNSGHWTLDGALTSQFEQHVRAVAGWPLGSTARLGRVTMRNLIGADAERWPEIAAEQGACLHLYGKREIRAGRKMGHVTRVTPE